jgi:hypothetical protein
MTGRPRALAGAIMLAVAAPAGAGDPAAADPRIAESRAVVSRFQQELSQRLAQALAAGGPVEAIDVCSREAPGIAARLAVETGTFVGRVSSAARNPANAADAGARQALARLEQALASQSGDPPWTFDVSDDGGATYMQAIVTQPLCVACHGTALAPDVASALARLYPSDRATGFAVGDLRGAFVVRWPASIAGPAP